MRAPAPENAPMTDPGSKRPRRGARAFPRLDARSLNEGVDFLVSGEPAFGDALARYGAPGRWARRPGFATLVRIIVEQQVSVGVAARIHARLRAACRPVTPAAVLALGEGGLRELGFSRRKAEYAHGLARAVAEGRLNPAGLALRPDEEVREILLAQRGLGPWSAEIYLLMALRRRDAWPSGDLALHRAGIALLGLPAEAPAHAVDERAMHWRPWRALAARILWTAYLAEQGNPLPERERLRLR